MPFTLISRERVVFTQFYPPENIKNLRFNHKYLKLSKMNKRRYYISMIRKKEFGIIHLVRTQNLPKNFHILLPTENAHMRFQSARVTPRDYLC